MNDWRDTCTCDAPLVRWSHGYHCVRCNPHVLAPCPICHLPVGSRDHRHSAAEVLQ